MNAVQHDLAILGGGPGGYVAAIRAAQLGLNVGCVEQESRLGGTCLRVGCIPSKALLESSEQFHVAQHEMKDHGVTIANVTLDLATMLKRKDGIVDSLTRGIDGLFKKNKITRYRGTGRFSGPGEIAVDPADGGKPVTLRAKHAIIATGSVPVSLPGVTLDYDRIGTSTEALSYPDVPGHLVVIGAGYIGLELGSVWKRLGAKVTVLEYLDRILPGMDAELANAALKQLEKQGLEFRLGSKVKGARVEGAQCVVEVDGAEPITCDRVLVAVGRKPNTEALNLAAVGIETDKRGAIPIDEHFRTKAEGVFAIGDVVRGPMLAHKAEEEGVACVELIATGYGHVDYDAIPGIAYTAPEVASVGKTEEQLKEAGIEYRKGKFPFAANGRAKALNHPEGFVKILADAKTDRVLGVHIIGMHAGDLIAEAATAMTYGASSEDIARTCHAHPTLAEAIKEAALAVDGRAIHI